MTAERSRQVGRDRNGAGGQNEAETSAEAGGEPSEGQNEVGRSADTRTAPAEARAMAEDSPRPEGTRRRPNEAVSSAEAGGEPP
jgi:hypothetical protein